MIIITIFWIITFGSHFLRSGNAAVQVKSVMMNTEVRLNLAVTWSQISIYSPTVDRFHFRFPLPTNAVLSNITISNSVYNTYVVVNPLSLEDLKKKITNPSRNKPSYKDYEFIEFDHMDIHGGETVTVLLCYEQLLVMRDFTFTHIIHYQPLSSVTSHLKASVRVLEPQYPEEFDRETIQQQELISPIERIYALKRVEEILARASSKHEDPAERIYLWTWAQRISAKYGFKTHVMTADLAADAKSAIDESVNLAKANFYQALENKNKKSEIIPDLPDVVKKNKKGSEKEAFEGADGDPHLIVTLRNLTVCFNVDGRNQSIINLLVDSNRGIEVTGLLSHDVNSKNEPASFFTTLTITMHRKHVNESPDYVTCNSSYVTFNDETFQWKVGSTFKRGRIVLDMKQEKPEAEIYFGEKIRLKVIRHMRERKFDKSRFSFLGVYVVNGTHITNGSTGFLGKQFFKNVSIVHSASDSQKVYENSSTDLITISGNRYPVNLTTVIDNSSMTRKPCWKILGTFYETFSNFSSAKYMHSEYYKHYLNSEYTNS
ncbi:inter-alpha-trypsin inhibitor heavy chain H3-like [Convolutriloba macropyga]|uniref:inter-alpha-trypsin inhibitor heavy chain H3-like n=1 Tax=Convolutriloba macropyga TaxID=536237 RepID=UPI003F51ECBE